MQPCTAVNIKSIDVVQGEGGTILIMGAHAPSTLDQGFNNTLAVSSALGGARKGIGVALHSLHTRRLEVVFSTSKPICHLQELKLSVVSPQRLRRQLLLVGGCIHSSVETLGEHWCEGK